MSYSFTHFNTLGIGQLRAKRRLLVEVAEAEKLRKDRPFKNERANILREAISAGTARPFDLAVCLNEDDNKTYRVNGQHSVAVLSELSDEDLSNVVIKIDYATAPNLEGVVELWGTYDSKDSARLAGDLFACNAGVIDEFDGIAKQTLKFAVTGLDMFEGETHPYQNHKAQDQPARFKNHAAVMRELAGMRQVRACPRLNLANTPAFLAILKEDAEVAKAFLADYSNESLPSNTPARRLCEYLTPNLVGCGRGIQVRVTSQTPPAREEVAKLVQGAVWYCFHAYRQNPMSIMGQISVRMARNGYRDHRDHYRQVLGLAPIEA